MTKMRDRAFAMFGAVLFLVTAVALSVAVIVSMIQTSNSKKQDNGAASTPAAKSAQQGAPVSNQTPTKLQGTLLSGLTPVASIPTLQAIDTTPGTGDTVSPDATVTVDYTGAVAATGVIFQSSKDTGKPVSFPLSGVIPGWTQGVPGMKVGGTRRLLIPAKLAYGANPPSGSGIPANADLIFDITLHSISK